MHFYLLLFEKLDTSTHAPGSKFIALLALEIRLYLTACKNLAIFDNIPEFMGSRDPNPFVDSLCQFLEIFPCHICIRVPNLNSLALLILEICSRVCKIVYGSRDLGHTQFLHILLVLEKLSI